jgi:hypothetical protein
VEDRWNATISYHSGSVGSGRLFDSADTQRCIAIALGSD